MLFFAMSPSISRYSEIHFEAQRDQAKLYLFIIVIPACNNHRPVKSIINIGQLSLTKYSAHWI